jgi:allantoate deiminase
MSRSPFSILSDEILARCDLLAHCSEEADKITRTCYCDAMHRVHAALRLWMERAGMQVRIDAAGNLIGHYPSDCTDGPTLLIGSHLDSVPDAGRYDGILGVLLGIAAVEALGGKRLPFAIDVIGFCEEEGIRFRTPFLGSLALCGRLDQTILNLTDDNGVSFAEALSRFGLNPARVGEAAYRSGKRIGYLEVHIEQGPILAAADIPLGIVDAIVGTTRCWLHFEGKAGHAGTMPMQLRQDALVAAAEWVVAVDSYARVAEGLRATVGSISVLPGAVNVIPGTARLSLDVRHPEDAMREQAVTDLLAQAATIARNRDVTFRLEHLDARPAVPSDARLTALLADTTAAVGHRPHRMVSGAGHDAAIMAGIAPMTMLFVRSPGGISHHPDESVLPADVTAALEVMVAFLKRLAGDFT